MKLAAEHATATLFSAFAVADLTPGSDRVQVHNYIDNHCMHTHSHACTNARTHIHTHNKNNLNHI